MHFDTAFQGVTYWIIILGPLLPSIWVSTIRKVILAYIENENEINWIFLADWESLLRSKVCWPFIIRLCFNCILWEIFLKTHYIYITRVCACLSVLFVLFHFFVDHYNFLSFCIFLLFYSSASAFYVIACVCVFVCAFARAADPCPAGLFSWSLLQR